VLLNGNTVGELFSLAWVFHAEFSGHSNMKSHSRKKDQIFKNGQVIFDKMMPKFKYEIS